MKDLLLTDEELNLAIRNAISDWALSGYKEGWGDDAMTQDNYYVIRKAQLAKVLKHRSRPELEKKIAEILEGDWIADADDIRNATDQLLALYPDERRKVTIIPIEEGIAEAKREERERILKALDDITDFVGGYNQTIYSKRTISLGKGLYFDIDRFE